VTGFIQFQEKPDIDAPGSWAGYYAGIASRITSLAIDLTLLAVVMAFVSFFVQQVMEFMRAGLTMLANFLSLSLAYLKRRSRQTIFRPPRYCITAYLSCTIRLPGALLAPRSGMRWPAYVWSL